VNKLKQVKHLQDGGDYNIINVIACLILLINNTVLIISKQYNIIYNLHYILPFLIYPILYVFVSIKKGTFYLYAIVGIITIILDPVANGYSGIIFIYLAYNEDKEKIKYISLVILSFVSLSIRFGILKEFGDGAVSTILVFSFIYISIYFKIIRDNTNITKLKEEEKAILKLYSNGYSYELIVTTLQLNITPITVQRKIKSVREKSGCKNNVQFGKWLYKNA